MDFLVVCQRSTLKVTSLPRDGFLQVLIALFGLFRIVHVVLRSETFYCHLQKEIPAFMSNEEHRSELEEVSNRLSDLAGSAHSSPNSYPLPDSLLKVLVAHRTQHLFVRRVESALEVVEPV